MPSPTSEPINNIGNYDVVITSPYGSVTSSVATVTVTLPGLQWTFAAGNSLNLHSTGSPGQNYVLQFAANLNPPINWHPLITNATDASGNWSYTNWSVHGRPEFFFRLALP